MPSAIRRRSPRFSLSLSLTAIVKSRSRSLKPRQDPADEMLTDLLAKSQTTSKHKMNCKPSRARTIVHSSIRNGTARIVILRVATTPIRGFVIRINKWLWSCDVSCFFPHDLVKPIACGAFKWFTFTCSEVLGRSLCCCFPIDSKLFSPISNVVVLCGECDIYF